jgi:hypothetical protein
MILHVESTLPVPHGVSTGARPVMIVHLVSALQAHVGTVSTDKEGGFMGFVGDFVVHDSFFQANNPAAKAVTHIATF